MNYDDYRVRWFAFRDVKCASKFDALVMEMNIFSFQLIEKLGMVADYALNPKLCLAVARKLLQIL